MFFVDHDQPKAWQRSEDGQARAQHHVGVAQVREHPMLQSLRRRQPAVQRDDAVTAEALGKAAMQLGRQVDLGHQHQSLSAGVEHALDFAQIDLGLAAAGGAVEQRHPWGALWLRLGQRSQNRRLLGARLGPFR